MSDRSFVRYGGLAGILLALTSWTAVVVLYTAVPPEQRAPVSDAKAFALSLPANAGGLSLFYGLLGLTAFWALAGIVAFYWRARAIAPAWSFYATVAGALASAGWLVSAAHAMAAVRVAATTSGATQALLVDQLVGGPDPADPLFVMTTGLTSVWFLISALILWRGGFPRLLAGLGFVAFADLALGFVASLLAIPIGVVAARVIAGAVGGPVFWLWLGYLLWRIPTTEGTPAIQAP